MNSEGIVHEDLSHLIVGAGMKVLNTLKPGLDEKAYENALAIELRKRGLRVDQQARFNVFYEGELVDTLGPDLILSGLMVVDPRWWKISPQLTWPRCRAIWRLPGCAWPYWAISSTPTCAGGGLSVSLSAFIRDHP